MNLDETMRKIEKEFAAAAQAQRVGNDGMVRVCARRAAGAAIGFWLRSHPHPEWGVDAMTQLRNLQIDDSTVETVRHAAERLTTKITEQFKAPFATDPLADARLIITHLTGQTI
ncbi:MAG: hypothetical protein ACKVRP_11495 [Bacteroidota bacterium]